jgi:RNA polymerase-binding transcription factor DksA
MAKKTEKKPVKKAVAKKPTPAKKAPAKKEVKKAPSKKTACVKKVAPVKKATPAKKATTAKKEAPAKKAAVEKKSAAKQAAIKVAEKTPLTIKHPQPEFKPGDTASQVAFAMSIAEEMKRAASAVESEKAMNEIKLSRRPTTRSQGKSTAKFPAADLKEFRKRLLEERDKAMNGVNAMKATGFNESDDHEADGGDGTNQTLRLQALGQMGNINRVIQQIEEALHRIDDGTYGVCTVCGQLIRKPRLNNQPFVLTCMECQSEMEKNHK